MTDRERDSLAKADASATHVNMKIGRSLANIDSFFF